MSRSPYQSKRIKFIPLLAILALIGGFIVYLGVSDLPAPTAPVEQEIPRDRFTPQSD